MGVCRYNRGAQRQDRGAIKETLWHGRETISPGGDVPEIPRFLFAINTFNTFSLSLSLSLAHFLDRFLAISLPLAK